MPDTKTDPKAKAAEQVVTLSADEYAKLQSENAALKAQTEGLKEKVEDLAARQAKTAADARTSKANALIERLKAEGRLTPALSARALPLMLSLDDEDAEAVTVTLSLEDGKTTEKKMSASQAFADFLSSLPKDANAPGAGTTRGDRDEKDGKSYGSLSLVEQREHMARVGDKLYAEDQAKPAADRVFPTLMSAYREAERRLKAGEAEVVSV